MKLLVNPAGKQVLRGAGYSLQRTDKVEEVALRHLVHSFNPTFNHHILARTINSVDYNGGSGKDYGVP